MAQQTKALSTIIKATLPIVRYSSSPSELSSVLAQRGELVVKRFGNDMNFLVTVNPDTQTFFAAKPQAALMGDYPTLRDIDTAYGRDFSVEWLVPQIADLVLYTGARNLTEAQQLGLARVIATEYKYLKVTEMLFFFYRFKTGRYGRFYGKVDPMVVTCALREFIKERNLMLDSFETEERQQALEGNKQAKMTYEEYLRIVASEKETESK